MPDTLSRLYGPTSIVSGDNTLFTGTAAHTYALRTIAFLNRSTSNSRTVKLAIVASAGTAVADGNLIATGTVAVQGMWAITMLVPLAGTEVLKANCSGGSITAMGAGLDSS